MVQVLLHVALGVGGSLHRKLGNVGGFCLMFYFCFGFWCWSGLSRLRESEWVGG